MENIIDRLEAVMEHFGLNNNSLTVKAKLSVGLIAQARKNRKGLHSDTIEKILLALPSVSPAWLVLGENGMMRKPHGEEAQIPRLRNPVVEKARLATQGQVDAILKRLARLEAEQKGAAPGKGNKTG